MDNGTQISLTLERMKEGGFLVTDAWRSNNAGMIMTLHFASTTIDEALKFMRDKVQPITTTSKPDNLPY